MLSRLCRHALHVGAIDTLLVASCSAEGASAASNARLRPGEDVERIAAIIAGDGWYSAPTHRPHSSPSNAVPPVPVDQCTLGNESAAWMQYELSRPQEGL